VGGSPCSIVYIKSEEGQQFSVCISLLNDIGIAPTANAISYSLSFDGEIIPDRMLLFPGERLVPRSRSVSATESGGFVQRQFHFSKLNVTEDGPKPKDGGGTDTLALGEICVSVLRFCKTGESSVSHYAQRKVPTGITTLHEKQLKGRDIAHSIGLAHPKPLYRYCTNTITRLSTPQPATKPNFAAGRYIDTNANPYLTIKFRYRSERTLCTHSNLTTASNNPPRCPQGPRTNPAYPSPLTLPRARGKQPPFLKRGARDVTERAGGRSAQAARKPPLPSHPTHIW